MPSEVPTRIRGGAVKFWVCAARRRRPAWTCGIRRNPSSWNCAKGELNIRNAGPGLLLLVLQLAEEFKISP